MWYVIETSRSFLFSLIVPVQSQGDLWYFPSGNPHSLQATNTTHGAEFLLIFDTGSFEEENTFLLTDWLSHIPKDVLAKNFGTGTDISPFDNIPTKELYIFKGTQSGDGFFVY